MVRSMWQTFSSFDFIHSFTTQVAADNIVMRVTRLSIVDWVYSKTQNLLVTLRTQNSLREESYASSEVGHLFLLVGCARNIRQCAHSSTESEIIFVGCGTAKGWISYSWFMVCGDRSVTLIDQHWNTNQSRSRKCSRNHKSTPKQKGNWDCEQLSHMDYVTTKANSSQGESQLYIFEDNEALIRMIIKGRSPTMRHVSRNHRFALDWWLDRINLDWKFKSNTFDTKNQLADILTKENFTRDERDHILQLLNLMNFWMFSCSNSLSNRKQCDMSKRAQGSTQKGRSAVAKPSPQNLVSRNLLSAKKNPPQDSSGPNSPRNQELDERCVSSRDRRLTRNINQNPTVYSQERQQEDTQSSSTRKLVRRDESSNSARARKLERGEDIQFGRSKSHFHNVQISVHRYFENVLKDLRKSWISQKTYQ